MTIDNAVNGVDKNLDSTLYLPVDLTDAKTVKPGEPSISIYKQRLADAIADIPPRRHELAVLRMYMDYRRD